MKILVMYPKEIRQIVIFRRSLGESYRQIALNLNIKKSAVDSIISYN